MAIHTPDPTFTVGLEEEYLLVDRETRDLVREPPPTLLAECERRLEGQVSPEFLRSQIEVQTRVFRTVGEARADLARLRRTVVEVAAAHGLADQRRRQAGRIAGAQRYEEQPAHHGEDDQRQQIIAALEGPSRLRFSGHAYSSFRGCASERRLMPCSSRRTRILR